MSNHLNDVCIIGSCLYQIQLITIPALKCVYMLCMANVTISCSKLFWYRLARIRWSLPFTKMFIICSFLHLSVRFWAAEPLLCTHPWHDFWFFVSYTFHYLSRSAQIDCICCAHRHTKNGKIRTIRGEYKLVRFVAVGFRWWFIWYTMHFHVNCYWIIYLSLSLCLCVYVQHEFPKYHIFNETPCQNRMHRFS